MKTTPTLSTYLFVCFLYLITGCNEDPINISKTGSIRGTVLNRDTQGPIVEAEITTVPSTTTLYTDSVGVFTYEDIAVGEYTVRVKKDDYEHFTKVLNVLENQVTEDTLYITKDPESIVIASDPTPVNQAEGVPLTITLSWEDKNDQGVTYQLIVFESNLEEEFLNVANLTEPTYTIKNLSYETTYYWQVNVMAKDSDNKVFGSVWNFKTIEFPNNRVLFVNAESGNYEIYSSELDSSSLVKVTATPQMEWNPRWNQTKDIMAFSSIDEGEFFIYTSNKSGSSRQKVTSLPLSGNFHNGEGFTWSPDYDAFAFSHYNKLYEVDKDGDDLRLLTTAPSGRSFRGVDWTSEGNKLVVETVGESPFVSEIYLYHVATNKLEVLVNDLPGVMKSPVFTIQGDKVIYTRDASGFENPSGRMLDSRIYMIDIASKSITDLSTNKPDGTNDLMPRLSPTGAQIIFVNAPNNNTAEGSIWMMDIDGNNRKELFASGLTPDWK